MTQLEDPVTLNQVVVIGGAGGFGRVFARAFEDSGAAVTTVDMHAGADIRSDLEHVSEDLRQHLSAADLIMMCVPEASALAILPRLAPLIEHQLLVDICSVKTKIAAAASELTRGEYVSLHPMFGPEKAFAGRNAVYIPVRDGPRAEAFRAQLKAWELNVIECDAATHDRITAMVQVTTHAVLATFAALRADADLDEALVQAFATPVFRELEMVSQGMVHENAELYHNIQTSNPNGPQARERLRKALEQTLAAFEAPSPQATREMFTRARRD